MNIAFDSSALHYELNRGIGKYIKSHIDEIIRIDNDNSYFIFDLFNNIELDELFIDKNINVVHFNLGKDGEFVFDEYSDVVAGVVKNFVELYDIDIFYITDLILPGYKNLYAKYLENKNCNVYMFLFDVIPYMMKDHYLKDNQNYKKYMECIELYKYADRIITDSNSAKNDLVSIFDIDKDIIDVVYAGPNPIFMEKEYSEEEINNTKRKFNIDNKYLLCVSGDDFRKNIDGLIKSYLSLPKEIINEYQLVIVCNISNVSKQRYLSLIEDKELIDNKRIIFTGYINDDDDIVLLNNMTDLFIFPSKYEGFGLPVLEAWKSGAPVVTSNNSSLYEIAKDAAIIVDPNSIESIKEGIIKGLNKEENNKLKDLGKKRSTDFTWNKNAIKTIEAFNKCDINKYSKELNKEENKKKIAFFTPLPPMQSGIADYSEDIISELSKYFDIDVVIDDNYEAEVSFNDNVKVIDYHKYNSSNYYKTIYQIGNSYFHTYMLDILRNNPENNVVVIHDINLHGLLLSYTNGWKKAYSLEKCLDECNPRVPTNLVMDDEHVNNNPQFFIVNPLNGFVSKYANKIITHSEYGKEKILEGDISRNIDVIYHYAKINDIKNRNEIRNKFNIPNDEIIISSFGNIQVTKRIFPIIEAFSKVVKKFNNTKLYLVGEPAKHLVDQINNLINEYNLKDKVVITGYTTIDDFKDYISATDICLNLRYPYNGETSGSLMRILGEGKVAILNKIGSFDEIPNECCYKIDSKEFMSDELEIKEIEKALTILIENHNMRESIANKAREFAIKELSLEIIAKKYKESIDDEVNKPCLNEDLLKNIKNTLSNEKYNEADARSIAKTLAFAIGESKEIKEKGILISDVLNVINGGK